MRYIKIENVRFKGKNNIKWDDVEHYLKDYAGHKYIVKLYGDDIQINAMFADEFTGSRYTERLKGAYAKVKANMATVIPELIANASNRRWQENKENKHNNTASKGWYRYDIGIEFPVSAVDEKEIR